MQNITTVNVLIYTLWGCSFALKVLVPLVLAARGIIRQYVILAALLALSATKTAFLMYTAWAHGAAAYKIWWLKLQYFDLFFIAALTVEAIYHMARHFPRSTKFAAVTSTVFGAVSLMAICWSAGIAVPPWSGAAPLAVWITRLWAGWCMLMVIANAWFHSIPLFKWRENARLHVNAATALMVVETLGMGILRWSQHAYAWVAVAQVVLGAEVPIAAYFWLRIRPSGEIFARPEPMPGLAELEQSRQKRIWRNIL